MDIFRYVTYNHQWPKAIWWKKPTFLPRWRLAKMVRGWGLGLTRNMSSVVTAAAPLWTALIAATFIRFMSWAPEKPPVARAILWKSASGAIFLSRAWTFRISMRDCRSRKVLRMFACLCKHFRRCPYDIDTVSHGECVMGRGGGRNAAHIYLHKVRVYLWELLGPDCFARLCSCRTSADREANYSERWWWQISLQISWPSSGY